ncbi:MAG: DNA lyase [Proteobacteria bacterium]|nr:DNA lyase [Pseudomonadota bacterium]
MRLWTLHPSYLDSKGLVALWREGLLAQAVLRGQTKGYRNHPQLQRFRSTSKPEAFIARYLKTVYDEASRRDYTFDSSKLMPAPRDGTIRVTRGQLAFERAHLQKKLQVRDPEWLAQHPIGDVVHPLFLIVPGGVEDWERVQAD